MVDYALMGAGMYGLNGISPEVSIHMVSAYIMPTTRYGLGTFRLTSADYSALASFHQRDCGEEYCTYPL